MLGFRFRAKLHDPYDAGAIVPTAVMAGRESSAQIPSAGDLGGLGGMIDRFRQSGLEDIINSWIGTGANRPISPDQLHQALGGDTVDDFSRETGVPPDDLLVQLSHFLPGVVDCLSPNGQVPHDHELVPGPHDEDQQN